MDASMQIAQRFSENLIFARKRAGLSQEELGFRCALHRTEVGLLERGTRIPRIDTLVKLAAGVSVPPADLLAGITWKACEFTRGRVPGRGAGIVTAASENSIAKRFGKNLVHARKRAGLSQDEVSLRASLHRTEVSQLERGLRVPQVDTLVKLASSLAISADELLDGISWAPGSYAPGGFHADQAP